MLPYEYCLASKTNYGGEKLDSINLINSVFELCLNHEQFEKSSTEIGKKEDYFYKAPKEVGFTLFKSKKTFRASFFELDLDGVADGIGKILKISPDQLLIVKNHPCCYIKFSSKNIVEVELLKAKNESIISSFEVAKYKDMLSQKINLIHIQDYSIQKYSDSFSETSVLTLEDFFTLLPEFENVEAWPRSGPADYRSFKYNLKKNDLNSFIQSKEFIIWLSCVTGLPLLHPAVPVYTRCIQAAGDYQILHGNYSEPYGVDFIFSFYPSKEYNNWPESSCGRIHYLNDSGDEIFQINPLNNSLTIVYRTEGCSRFTENVKGNPEIPLFQTVGIYSVAEDDQ